MPGDSSDKEPGFKSLSDDVKRYIEKRLELFTLTVSEHVSFILADSMQKLIGILLLACGFLIAWFGLSYYLSELVGSYSLGFIISSLPLFIGGFIFLKMKPKSVTRMIQSGIIQEVISSFEDLEIKQQERRDRKKRIQEEADRE
jgi:Zn-dependent protease with chaperone function